MNNAQFNLMRCFEHLSNAEIQAVGDFIRLKLFYDNHSISDADLRVAGDMFLKARRSFNYLFTASKGNYFALIRTPQNENIHLENIEW